MNAEDSNRRRNRGILEAGASAVVGKAVGLLANLISLPIAVRYLGPVQFGIWATISTTLTLLFVLDFGIANTLTNFISEAYAREDKGLASSYASSAFWLMVMVATALGLVGWMAWPFVNWNYVFHVNASDRCDVSTAVAVGYVVFLVAMPAGLAAKLLGGYQELQIANLFAAGGGVGSLIAIVLVVRLHGGLPTMLGASYGAMALANGICLLWIWLYHKPWLTPWPRHVSFAVSRRLLGSGSGFFILQIAGLIVFNSDNIVITHFLGPAAVTPYNVTWRLVGYASVLQTFMFPALWPAYSEAYVRGDIHWIRKTYWYVMKLTISTTGAFCIMFLIFGRIIIRYWAGHAAVPAQSLVVTMCAWVMISAVMNNEACLLVATNVIRLQVWIGVIAAIINLALSILLVLRIGVLGVIMGTVLSYIVIVVGPQTWKVAQLMKSPTVDQ
jgi:O-antigen/teichoic acid export membrane protein